VRNPFAAPASAAVLFLALFQATGAARAEAPGSSLAAAVERFTRESAFDDLALSPTGEYLAATVPQGDKTILVVMRRSDRAVTSVFRMEGKSHVTAFWWVNPKRLLLSVGQKFGSLEQPRPTGEIYALDAEGNGAEILAGPRAGQQQTGSNIRVRDDGSAFAFLFDTLVADDETVLVAMQDIGASRDAPMTRAERMDVDDGRRRIVARAPISRADFTADHAGAVRYATGLDIENYSITYYRENDDAEWTLLNHQRESGRAVAPIGFSADNAVAYLRVGQPKGPDVIEAMDVATGQRSVVLRDDVADPDEILFDLATGAPIGARFSSGVPRSAWFDAAHPAVRTRRSLEAAFPGDRVSLRSVTSDGRLQLVYVSSDRNPGDYYLFDTVAKTAELLVSAAEWLHPDDMAAMRPVSITARDGLVLHGYLTVPKGSDGKNLPMVVRPHGGPIDIRDDWAFQPDVQLLASQGYAVLQVNFRGSSGFGDAFRDAGFRQWGRAMQDDLTDATRWAIDEGIADANRICIAGSSYGGYAALMGAVREPTLYRCVAGDIGVYDLAMMFKTGDVQEARWGENYLRDSIGTEGLDAISPAKLADRIQVPVFLSAGAEDERAPAEHTEAMESALRRAGKPVEMVIYPKEGHGYYLPENRRDFYTRLLTFLDTHLKPAN
jgi:dipeptidyl aminopeptidase/acylaminoacyl peptidase